MSLSRSKLFKNLPTSLSVSKSIEPSPAIFFSKFPDGHIEPIGLWSFDGAGTFSAMEHKKGRDIGATNPYQADQARLASNADTLLVKMTLTVDDLSSNFSSCNDANFKQRMQGFFKEFFAGVGGYSLSKSYVDALLSCVWLHRNRKALSKKIRLSFEYADEKGNLKTGTFESTVLNKSNSFSGEGYDHLVSSFAKALGGGLDSKLYISVEVEARLGMHQTVFPSQLWIDQSDGVTKGRKEGRKSLYIADRTLQATGLSSTKVGNGLRTIDTWHDSAAGAVAVSPYGVKKDTHEVLRPRERQNDFYTLLSVMEYGLEENLKTIRKAKTESDIPGSIYFVVSNFVRGGMFSSSTKENMSKETE
ncbi:type I-F CRISPR-associated protein Cas7f/Csy3 [Pseudomonas luteola]